MLKVQFESVLKNQVLIEKETLEKLIQIAKQVDEIEIEEVILQCHMKFEIRL